MERFDEKLDTDDTRRQAQIASSIIFHVDRSTADDLLGDKWAHPQQN